MSTNIKGIDVSKWQGTIDWPKVAGDGVKFAMIRLGYGSKDGTARGVDGFYEKNVENALVPVLCLLITAGGAYLVALVKRQTAQLQQQIDDETLNKYMDMAADAVVQAVTYTAQTFVDALKAQGAFTKEKQLEAFQKSKDKVLEILGDTVVDALGALYGDFDAWLTTKIEQVCRDIKTPEADAATTAAATTAASVAAAITSTAVQQLAAEAAMPGAEAGVEVEITEETGDNVK